jgi:hypothetical protein
MAILTKIKGSQIRLGDGPLSSSAGGDLSVKVGGLGLTYLDIDGATDVGEALVDADLIIVDNGAGGTNRKSVLSRIPTYLETKALNFANYMTITHGAGLKVYGSEGTAGVFTLAADESDDDGDEWKFTVADSTGVMTIGNDKTASDVAHMTLTPHIVVAQSTVAFPGLTTFAGASLKMTADASAIHLGADTDVTITHDNSNGLDIAAGGDLGLTASAGHGSFIVADGYELLLGKTGAASLTLAPHGTAATELITMQNVAGTTDAAIKLASDAGGITLDAATDIVLDAAGGNIEFSDAGTLQLSIDMDTEGGAQIIRTEVPADDLVFMDSDDKEGFRILDDAAGVVITGDEAGGAILYMKSDQSDDASDDWKINAADGGVMTFGNDIASEGTFVTHMTLTPHASVASSTAAFAGGVTVAGDLTVSGTTTTVKKVEISTANGVVFEGATDDGNETTLKAVDPTADNAIWLSNAEGYIPLLVDATTTDGAVTQAEFALLDGGTARGTDAVADGDGILTNDGGTMRQTSVQTFQTYFDANSVGGTSIVTVGALNAGTITSGFGAIDNGTSGIRTATFTAETSVVADADGGADLGTTSVGWGDVYIADDKKLQFGSDQDATIEYDEDGEDVVQYAGAALRIGHGAATQLQFRDSAIHIASGADGALDLTADGSIDLNVGAAGVLVKGTTPKLTIGDAGAEDTFLVFDGNAQDYRIGLDDGTDKLEMGVGAAHGTTTSLTLDSSRNVDIPAHNGTIGLSLGGTIVTSTAAELNLLDGVSGLVQADFTKLAALDATAAELNIMDAGTTQATVTLVAADGIVINDANDVMKQCLVSDIATYLVGSNPGIKVSLDKLVMDISSLAPDNSALSASTDYLAIYDATSTTTMKVTLAQLQEAIVAPARDTFFSGAVGNIGGATDDGDQAMTSGSMSANLMTASLSAVSLHADSVQVFLNGILLAPSGSLANDSGSFGQDDYDYRLADADDGDGGAVADGGTQKISHVLLNNAIDGDDILTVHYLKA